MLLKLCLEATARRGDPGTPLLTSCQMTGLRGTALPLPHRTTSHIAHLRQSSPRCLVLVHMFNSFNRWSDYLRTDLIHGLFLIVLKPYLYYVRRRRSYWFLNQPWSDWQQVTATRLTGSPPITNLCPEYVTMPQVSTWPPIWSLWVVALFIVIYIILGIFSGDRRKLHIKGRILTVSWNGDLSPTSNNRYYYYRLILILWVNSMWFLKVLTVFAFTASFGRLFHRFTLYLWRNTYRGYSLV